MSFSAIIAGDIAGVEGELQAVETRFLNDIHALVAKYDHQVDQARRPDQTGGNDTTKGDQEMSFSATIAGDIAGVEGELQAVETRFLNDIHALVAKYDDIIGVAKVTTSAGETDVKAAVSTVKDATATEQAVKDADEKEAADLHELDAAGIKTPEPEPTPEPVEDVLGGFATTAPEASDTPS